MLQQVFMTNMKKWRKEAGFTQEKLAELCNTDSCYIRQIETGRRFPSIAYIERIATALKIPPYCLFYDETDAYNETHTHLRKEQKQKLRALLFDNISRVCSVIDEQF